MKKQLFTTIMVVLLTTISLQAQTWTDVHNFAPGGITFDGTNVYKVKLDKTGLYTSTDEGLTWTLNDSILFGQSFGTKIGTIIFPTSTGRLITTRGKNSTFKIIYSDDQGLNWIETSNTLQDHVTTATEINGVIYMSPNSGIPKYSNDNGLSWTNVPLDVRGKVAGADNNNFYVPRADSLVVVNSTTMVASARYILSQTGGVLKSYGQRYLHIKSGKVYLSTDQQNWTDITTDGVFTANAMLDAIVVGTDIFLIGAKGLYKSIDNGNSWTNPGGQSLSFLKLTATTNYIIGGYNFSAAGYTYRINAIGSTSIDELVQNEVNIYPNPTNGLVKLNLSKHNGFVNYTIMSVDGRVVTQEQNITSSIMTINLNNESKGIYLLRIEDATSSKVYKIIKE